MSSRTGPGSDEFPGSGRKACGIRKVVAAGAVCCAVLLLFLFSGNGNPERKPSGPAGGANPAWKTGFPAQTDSGTVKNEQPHPEQTESGSEQETPSWETEAVQIKASERIKTEQEAVPEETEPAGMTVSGEGENTGKTEAKAEKETETETATETENGVLPEWISWEEKEIPVVADPAETADRTAVLSEKKVRIGEWESPANCLIQDMLVCDIDSDGENELLLLLWKVGTNVDLKLWNRKKEEGWGQHIYIFDILDEDIQPIWWASGIGLIAESWEFNEKRRLIIYEHSGQESCWDWDGFGLKLRPYVSFMATGDLMIHKAIYDYGLSSGKGFGFLFDEIRSDLEEADVSVCQEETVLVEEPAAYSSYPYFGSPAEVGREIIRSGFDVVELASNHMLDKGYGAVDFTTGLYEENGVMYLGAQPSSKAENEPYKILERQGIRFALFNYTFSVNGQPVPEEYPDMIHILSDEERVREELESGKENSDFVIVFVHWGTEYDQEIDAFQKKWAEIFLDCGVGVTVGSHPHVLQKMELLRKGDRTMLCYYSLGNLISTMDKEGCQVGGLAKFNVLRTSDGCRLAGYELKEIDSSF